LSKLCRPNSGWCVEGGKAAMGRDTILEVSGVLFVCFLCGLSRCPEAGWFLRLLVFRVPLRVRLVCRQGRYLVYCPSFLRPLLPFCLSALREGEHFPVVGRLPLLAFSDVSCFSAWGRAGSFVVPIFVRMGVVQGVCDWASS